MLRPDDTEPSTNEKCVNFPGECVAFAVSACTTYGEAKGSIQWQNASKMIMLEDSQLQLNGSSDRMVTEHEEIFIVLTRVKERFLTF